MRGKCSVPSVRFLLVIAITLITFWLLLALTGAWGRNPFDYYGYQTRWRFDPVLGSTKACAVNEVAYDGLCQEPSDRTRIRADQVHLFVSTSRRTMETRYAWMEDTWMPEAAAMGFGISTYVSLPTAAHLQTRFPNVIVLNATDGWPPYDIYVEISKHWMHRAVDGEAYYVHIDDDTYVRPERLLDLVNTLYAQSSHYFGRNARITREGVGFEYTGGPLVVWSRQYWEYLRNTRVDIAKALSAFMPFTHNCVCSDVFWGYLAGTYAGVRPHPSPPADFDSPIAHAEKDLELAREFFNGFNWRQQLRTVAYHKFEGECIMRLHNGDALAGCDATKTLQLKEAS